jgi:hypothetical protein
LGYNSTHRLFIYSSVLNPHITLKHTAQAYF